RSDLWRAGVNGRLAAGWKTQLQVSRSIDDSDTLEGAFLPSDFKTTQDQFLWQNDVDTPLGVALLGVERLEQRVDIATAYTVTRRTVRSVFAGLNGEAGAHGWQINLRNDRNSQFGNSTTGFVGYGYRLTPALRVHASHGTSFVAPSFNQLYYPGF